jgi:hypothetical protein
VSVWEETIARRLHALHLDSIRSQILVFAVLATLVPTLTTTIVAYRQNRRLERDRATVELRRAGVEAAWELDQWLAERLHDLRVAAGAFAVSENLNRIEGNGGQASGRLRDYLGVVRERCADCEALLISDARGRVVATSGGRMSGVQFSLDRLSGLRTGDALVGDPYWDVGAGKAAITLAVPIRQADGRFQGTLTAKVNLRAVADLIQRLSPGDGGDAYAMTDQGRLVLRSRVSSAELMRTKLPAATMQALLDNEGAIAEYKRADGQEVLGMARRVPPLRWAAVVEVPRAEALGGTGSGHTLVARRLARRHGVRRVRVGTAHRAPARAPDQRRGQGGGGRSRGGASERRRRRGRLPDAGVQEPRDPRAGAGRAGGAGAALRHRRAHRALQPAPPDRDARQ